MMRFGLRVLASVVSLAAAASLTLAAPSAVWAQTSSEVPVVSTSDAAPPPESTDGEVEPSDPIDSGLAGGLLPDGDLGGLTDFDVTDGLADLAPEEIEGHELGAVLSSVSIDDLIDDDGLFEWEDASGKMTLARLGSDAASTFDGAFSTDASRLASLASSAAVSYVPPHNERSNDTSAVAIAEPEADNWFVSDTGQLYLPVGGVLVLFEPGFSDADIDAIWTQYQIAPGRVLPVEGFPQAFKIDTSSDVESLQLVKLLSRAPGVASVAPNTFTPDVVDHFDLVSFSYPSLNTAATNLCKSDDPPLSDALSACLWYIDRSEAKSVSSGGKTYEPLVDINIGDVWDTTKGSGITVSIVDSTWEADHEDLVGNSDRAASTYWPTTRRRSWHATAVAGLIGARDNNLGGRGVAPRSTLLNVNYLDSQSLYNSQQAFLHRADTVAVANHSYGKSTRGSLGRWSLFAAAALEQSLKSGFGGKGTLHVKSVGNGKDDGVYDEASLTEELNHHGFVVVCGVNSAGTDTAYSEEGTNLWVCGPAAESPRHGLLSTIGKNHYHAGLRGTSFSAPVVSGVAALVRSVNTALTWRDVKLILAGTAQKNDSSSSSWQAGAKKYGSATESYSYSRKYGFGLVDASAAVSAAQNWKLLPPMIANSGVSGPLEASGEITKDGNANEFAITLNSDVEFVEHVDVNVRMDTKYFRALKLTLISPSGKESVLVNPAGSRWCVCRLNGGFKFASARHLGESATGTWKLKIENLKLWNDAKLVSWGVTVYGHNPSYTEVVSLTTSGGTTEGGDITFTATHQGTTLTSDLVVPIVLTSDAATPPGQPDPDYTELTSITIPTGSSTASATISTTEDNTHEFTEVIVAKIGAMQAPYTSDGLVKSVTVMDDDQPRVSISAIKSHVNEGEEVQFAVTMDRDPVKAMTVYVTASEHHPQTNQVSSFYLPRTLWPSLEFTAAGTKISRVTTKADRNDEPQRIIRGSLPYLLFGNHEYEIIEPRVVKTVIDDTKPLVSIIAGNNVSEGTSVSFTLTAKPAPSAALNVAVEVTATGDFGVTTGSRTVTIPTTGTATLLISTTGDSKDEADGSVSVSVTDDIAYYVESTAESASVVVSDDDDPPPVVVYVVPAGLIANVKGYAAETGNGAAHVNRWKRVLVAFGESLPGFSGSAMTVVEAQGHAQTFWSVRWDPVVVALQSLAANPPPQQQPMPPPATPVISITAGSDVTEGGAALFTVSASPAPSSALTVTVNVTASGSFGVTTGNRTVTIPTTGSATLTVDTSGDSTDEADGSVTVSVTDGAAYDVDSTADSATVNIADDDVPEISITAGSNVTEGAAASFTLSASPAPSAALSVSVDVSAVGSFGVTAGSRTVTIPTTGSATLSISTSGDSVDEADGSVSVSVVDGASYDVDSTAGSATVNVSDDDDPPPPVVVYVVPASLIANVKGYAAETFNGVPHVNRWKRVLVAFGEDVPGFSGSAMTVVEAQGHARAFWSVRWDPVVVALQSLAANPPQQQPTPPPATPVVSITAGSDVTEGGAALFTVSASPVPSGSLVVTVNVAATGSFGVTTGSRTLTVPTSGTATLSVATSGDSTDEANGSVTVSVTDGASYDVHPTAGSATVNIADDDDPPPPPPVTPVVSVTAGSGVTEGSNALFTVSASPAPSSSLVVTVNVTASGSFGVATGSQTVTVPTSGSATLSVSTSGDSTDEADGSVTVSVTDGASYDVSSTAGSATVAISDDDDPLPPPPVVVGDVKVSVDGQLERVGPGGTLEFVVKLSKAADSDVKVGFKVSAVGGAWLTVGLDYVVRGLANKSDSVGELTFARGETRKVLYVDVPKDAWIFTSATILVSLTSTSGGIEIDSDNKSAIGRLRP